MSIRSSSAPTTFDIAQGAHRFLRLPPSPLCYSFHLHARLHLFPLAIIPVNSTLISPTSSSHIHKGSICARSYLLHESSLPEVAQIKSNLIPPLFRVPSERGRGAGIPCGMGSLIAFRACHVLVADLGIWWTDIHTFVRLLCIELVHASCVFYMPFRIAGRL